MLKISIQSLAVFLSTVKTVVRLYISGHLFIIIFPYVSFFLSSKISHLVFQQFGNDVHRCDFLCIYLVCSMNFLDLCTAYFLNQIGKIFNFYFSTYIFLP